MMGSAFILIFSLESLSNSSKSYLLWDFTPGLISACFLTARDILEHHQYKF